MNPWAAFQKLVASGGPLQIGEVVAMNSTFGAHRATVRLLPGLALVEVAGPGRTLEIGQRWVVQDGRIIDEAPQGAVVLVEV